MHFPHMNGKWIYMVCTNCIYYQNSCKISPDTFVSISFVIDRTLLAHELNWLMMGCNRNLTKQLTLFVSNQQIKNLQRTKHKITILLHKFILQNYYMCWLERVAHCKNWFSVKSSHKSANSTQIANVCSSAFRFEYNFSYFPCVSHHFRKKTLTRNSHNITRTQ